MSTPRLRSGQASAARRSSTRLWLGVGLVAVVGLTTALVFVLDENAQQAEIIDELQLNKEDLQLEIEQLDRRVERTDAELAKANVDLKKKTEDVEQLLGKIAYLQRQLRAAIKQGELSEKERQRYQGQYEQLAFYNKRYRAEIAALKEENAKLKAQLAAAGNARDSLENTVGALENDLIQTEIQLETAKALTAIDFQYTALKRVNKPFDGKEVKQRDLQEGLQVCCTVAANNAAAPGKRTVYLLVLAPNGPALTNFNRNSGYFELRKKKTAYTAKAELDYTGSARQLCLSHYFKPGEEPLKGTYTVKLYAEGFLLGEDTFEVQ